MIPYQSKLTQQARHVRGASILDNSRVPLFMFLLFFSKTGAAHTHRQKDRKKETAKKQTTEGDGKEKERGLWGSPH